MKMHTLSNNINRKIDRDKGSIGFLLKNQGSTLLNFHVKDKETINSKKPREWIDYLLISAQVLDAETKETLGLILSQYWDDLGKHTDMVDDEKNCLIHILDQE